MTIIIIILSTFTLLFAFSSVNLLIKNEKLEDIFNENKEYILKLKESVNKANKTIDIIDQKGTFKSDDEVGYFFEELKKLNEDLKLFK